MSKSENLYSAARELIPGGVNSPVNDRVERAIAATTVLIVFIINLSQVIFV